MLKSEKKQKLVQSSRRVKLKFIRTRNNQILRNQKKPSQVLDVKEHIGQNPVKALCIKLLNGNLFLISRGTNLMKRFLDKISIFVQDCHLLLKK